MKSDKQFIEEIYSKASVRISSQKTNPSDCYSNTNKVKYFKPIFATCVISIFVISVYLYSNINGHYDSLQDENISNNKSRSMERNVSGIVKKISNSSENYIVTVLNSDNYIVDLYVSKEELDIINELQVGQKYLFSISAGNEIINISISNR